MKHPLRLSAGKQGFLLTEAIIGIAIFGMFVTAVHFSLLSGEASTVFSGHKIRATYLTEKALEAVRSMRDEDFDDLTDASVTASNPHGIRISPTTKTWELYGTGTTTQDGFTTYIVITNPSENRIVLQATTTWGSESDRRPGNVALTTELTNWRVTKPIGDWSTAVVTGFYKDPYPDTSPLFNSVAVGGDYAYLGGDISSGGKGLYVFNISTGTPDLRNQLDVLGSVHDVAVKGSRLYMIVDYPDPVSADELRVINILTPESSLPTLVTVQFPSDDVRSMTLDGNTLYVGTASKVYIYDVSDPDSVTERGSFTVYAPVNDIAISGNTAYLATSVINAELMVLDISNPASPQWNSSYSHDVAIDQAPASIAVGGNSLLLGALDMSNPGEALHFPLTTDGLPSATNANLDTGGSALGAAIDPLGCYGFVAADFASKDLQIIDLLNGFVEEGYLEADAGAAIDPEVGMGNGRGVLYDYGNDRLYLTTADGFLILRPGAASGPCVTE